MPDSISSDNSEKVKSLRFFFLLLLRGVGIMFDHNCRENSQCWLYSTSERGKILSYKGLRQAGLIGFPRKFFLGQMWAKRNENHQILVFFIFFEKLYYKVFLGIILNEKSYCY